MKKIFMFSYLSFSIPLLSFPNNLFSQNVGFGITAPLGKVHIKGSSDVSQLVIDAGSTQSNTSPLIKLRNSSGSDLLWIHADNPHNTFLGLNSGKVNSPSGGLNNVFIGRDAGFSNTTGDENSGTGHSALFSNTTGYQNVANGTQSLYSNTTGYQNTAVGSKALYFNDIGFYNTANGFQALYSNTSGYYNNADGAAALYSNTIGDGNIAVGAHALYDNTEGNANTGIGAFALENNTIGTENVAVGVAALQNSTTAIHNIVVGNYALSVNTTGAENTALGYAALGHTTISDYNTALGFLAGNAFDNGSNNVFVGALSDVIAAGGFNMVGVGAGCTLTANNSARLGNASITSTGGWTNWTNVSDGRFKNNIQDNVRGLDFILKLRPITYHLKASALSELLNEGRGKPLSAQMQDALNEKEKITYSGFIAQEVEAAAKELGYDFSGVDAPKNENDLYGLRYAEFVVPLVKAVQELSEKNEELTKRIEQLEKLLEGKN